MKSKFFFFFIMLFFIMTFTCSAKTVWIIQNEKIITKDFDSEKFEKSYFETIAKYSHSIQNVKVIRVDQVENLWPQLRKDDLVVYILYGFDELVTSYLEKFPRFDCKNKNSLVLDNQLDYQALISPTIDKLNLVSEKIRKKEAIQLNFWSGAGLKYHSLFLNKLGCRDSREIEEKIYKRSYLDIQNIISLKDYPINVSNLLNIDLLFKRKEGDLIPQEVLMNILIKGLEPLMISELNHE